jgi:site-specific recombinase XerD
MKPKIGTPALRRAPSSPTFWNRDAERYSRLQSEGGRACGVARRAYETAVKDFMRFVGIRRPEEFRIVTRAHTIARRDELARRGLSGSTIRHRLASLASLFEYLSRDGRSQPQSRRLQLRVHRQQLRV